MGKRITRRWSSLVCLAGAIATACSTGVRQRAPVTVTPAATVTAAAAPASDVDPATLAGKLMFGYQGWFGCPGDGSPLSAWEHWFRRGAAASVSTLRVDMWPDVSDLSESERCNTPLVLPGGQSAQLFSAYNPRTVDRHFAWLQEYDLAGVFLQRFTSRLDDRAVLGFRDGVARNVKAAAEAHGRVFAIMYDISGHPRETVVRAVEDDWRYMVDILRITDSPRYLQHHRRPVLAIWGFGFRDRAPTPEQAAELIAFFKDNPEPRYRVTLLGGIPARWRTLSRDSQTEEAWAQVYRSFDILSPWTVGRFKDEESTDRFYDEEVEPDLVETHRLGLEYMPVVFPGFSWHNMNPAAPFNPIPRRGGRFYWHQIERALQAGVTMMYGAMFDEVDEGTAMFKLAPTRDSVPAGAPIVTLDADGEHLPSDWYLQLARQAQRRLSARGPSPRR
ncbi:MAG: glycoside hydrolase family 71/99-like protein [Vicinamibacterales bacterium]